MTPTTTTATTMLGRTVLVTGSTGGIGKETARGLARLGARVVLVGRDPARAQSAAAEINHDIGTDRAESVAVDLTVRRGLRQLVDTVAERHTSLDVLINNFGMNPAARQLTSDGVELAFAANVLAPYTLTLLLEPLLRAAPSARVVNITGGIPGGPVDPDNLQAEKGYVGWTFSQYNHTKAALMAVSYDLARRLTGNTEGTAPGVTLNVAYPGHAYTPGNRAMAPSAFPLVYRPLAPLLRVLGPVLLSDLAKPARSSILLAAGPEVEGVTGAYFNTKGKRVPWPAFVRDERIRTAVGDLCARLM